jgi:uncharacterized membrane protein
MMLISRDNIFMMETLLHLGVSAYLTGLIWLVQIVHYPTFLWVEEKNYTGFAVFHTRTIGYVVAPAMIIELILALRLLLGASLGVGEWARITILFLTALLWLSTIFLQIPLHNKLVKRRDEEAIKKLIQTNWIRTFAWSAKVLVLSWMLIKEISGFQ